MPGSLSASASPRSVRGTPAPDRRRTRFSAGAVDFEIYLSAHPADGGGFITLPLSSAPIEMSSYFCDLRLRQPLPAVIGGAISGGIIGIPAASPAPSGVAAEAN
jgi:hypothetical protein